MVDSGGVGVILRNDVGLLGDGVLCEKRVGFVVFVGLHFLNLDVVMLTQIHGDFHFERLS